MSKQSTSSPVFKQFSLNEDFTDQSLLDWLNKNKRLILISLLVLLAFLILAYRFLSARNLQAEEDYLRAQTDFNRFQEKSIKPEDWKASLEDLNHLKILLNRHPELGPKYEGLIAQTLLIEQNALQAFPFAESAWKRTQNDSTALYHDYASTSLLITSGKYQEALDRAEQLKEKMNTDTIGSASEILYLFNQVRLAILYQQLDRFKEERQIWQEVQQNSNPAAVSAFQQIFNESQTSINQYIEERKKALSS